MPAKPSPDREPEVSNARSKLVRAGQLHWIHWLVVLFSLALTIFAWRYSTQEHEKRVALRFETESERITDLIVDRMRKYEEALWGGTALIKTLGGEVSLSEWDTYATALNIGTKYPGISGIGVIHALTEAELPDYLAGQRLLRPDFSIHPDHAGQEFYPITYIVPEKGNEKAVGLDMAHEVNRFTAAKKARDTGMAQITGPITLVQDAEKTPGFLFYAPFYQGGNGGSLAERQAHFSGLVYAPFVVKRLMLGVLSRERREVGLRIMDGTEVLYDENVPGEHFFDPNPLFVRELPLSLYGRNWVFQIRSASSFREAYASNEPLTILLGGIGIDVMLVILFFYLARSARNALQLADSMSEEVGRRAKELETLNVELKRSNQELDDFAHIASHDLKEPLRGIRNYVTFLQEDYEAILDDEGRDKLITLGTLSERLTLLIDELHQISRVGRESFQLVDCDTGALVEDIVATLTPWLEGQHTTIKIAPNMPRMKCHPAYAGQVFRNLITNGVKYNDSPEKRIEVGWKYEKSGSVAFYVKDNGIGIPEKHRQNVFRIFKRLHGREKYGGGSGAGLAVAKKIIERHNGRIWIESTIAIGTVIYFTLDTTESR